MSTEVSIITENQFKEIISKGSEILRTSELRVSKAISVGEKLFAEIQTEGMDEARDERCNKYLVNARAAKLDIENQRKPITAYFDAVRKEFTSLEGQLDPKKLDGIPAKIQSFRDAYVKKIRDEEAAKQRAAQAKIDKENEVIEIRSRIATQFSEFVQNHITGRKQKLQNSFNTITLDNFKEKSEALKNLVPAHTLDWNTFTPNVFAKNLSAEEVSALSAEYSKSVDYTLMAGIIAGDLQKFIKELTEKLPSLKTSLEEMAKAGAEEQQRLAAEKAKREAEAEAKIKADAEAEKERQAKDAEVAKIADQTNAMMDNMAVVDTVAPETRDGYKINILNKTAIAEIFTFWFQREGMTLSIPELEKKSITQMKAYCEKLAHKSGDMIQSVNLTYETIYKAVNRK